MDGSGGLRSAEEEDDMSHVAGGGGGSDSRHCSYVTGFEVDHFS